MVRRPSKRRRRLSSLFISQPSLISSLISKATKKKEKHAKKFEEKANSQIRFQIFYCESQKFRQRSISRNVNGNRKRFVGNGILRLPEDGSYARLTRRRRRGGGDAAEVRLQARILRGCRFETWRELR